MKITHTQYAHHLVRLTRMCHDVLVAGEIAIRNPNRAELSAIRNETWTYDQLKEYLEK